MGAFRTLLALLVVCSHIAGADNKASINWLTGGGIMAVNVFFLLSGFYMTLVLDRKYKNRTGFFFLSRALRLYPLYWITLVLTLLGCWVMHFNSTLIMPAGFFKLPGAMHKLLNENVVLGAVTLAQNFTFLGLDFNSLLCVAPHSSGIYLMHGDNKCLQFSLGNLSLVPQAWSLGTELLFYVAIPFILRGGNKLILATTILAVMANIVASLNNINHLLYNRDIFFIPLIYFMMGVISFKSYTRWGHHLPGKKAYWPLLLITSGLALSYTYNFNYGFHAQDTSFWSGINSIYYVIISILTPALFHASKQSRWDSFFGEFSYPIYVTHFLGFTLAFTLPHIMGFDIHYYLLRFVFDISCVVAVAVSGFFLVVRPIEILRGRKTLEERHRLTQFDMTSAYSARS